MTKEQAVALLTPLFVAFKEKDEERLSVYAEVLKDKPMSYLKASVMTCISKYKFMPSVAEILSEMRSVDDTASNNNPEQDWNEAWQILYSEMQRCACTNRKPDFKGNEVLEEMFTPATFYEFGLTMEKDMPIVKAQIRNQFYEARKRIETRKRNSAILSKLNVNELLGVPIKQISK